MKRHFHSFDIRPGWVGFACTTSHGDEATHTDRLYFQMSSEVTPRNDLIAVACSTLCGRDFREIEFDLPLSYKVVEGMGEFTGARITAPAETERERRFRIKSEFARSHSNSVILNYSGGFDSLAMAHAVPEGTHLVAVNWGGDFVRERVMFERANPETVTTNVRQLGYDRHSHSFMGIGAILYADHLNARYAAYGSVLDSLTDYWREGAKGSDINWPFNLAGLGYAGFATGLTEVATTRLVRHFAPDEIAESVESLSAPGTEKHFRKCVLLEADAKLHPWQPYGIDCVQPPMFRGRFGESFLTDVLALYVFKHLGRERAEQMVSGIPDEATALASRLDLTFMERLNPQFLWTIPEEHRAGYIAKLATAGIIPYADRDAEEFREVADYLLATRATTAVSAKSRVIAALKRMGLGWVPRLLHPVWLALGSVRRSSI